jgi:hypothetical protein
MIMKVQSWRPPELNEKLQKKVVKFFHNVVFLQNFLFGTFQHKDENHSKGVT